MNTKLDKLIENYLEGKISTKYFTDEFTIIFGQEIDYGSLGDKKYKLFDDLYEIVARYSPDQEEINKYGVHYNEDVVRAKAKEVWDSVKN